MKSTGKYIRGTNIDLAGAFRRNRQEKDAEEVKQSLKTFEAFLRGLPRDYRHLAIFVSATGVRSEIAVGLEVKSVIRLRETYGLLGAIQELACIPVHTDYQYFLPVHINGRRSRVLRYNGIPADKEPSQVFLDSKGQPMTMAKVNLAFKRVSRRMNLEQPVTLEDIAQAARTKFLNIALATKPYDLERTLAYLKPVRDREDFV